MEDIEKICIIQNHIYLYTYDNNSKNKIWPKELCLIPLVEQ